MNNYRIKKFKQFVNETVINENIIEISGVDSLVGKRFQIEEGSSGHLCYGGWEKEKLLEKLRSVIKHELFSGDFCYNWTRHDREYRDVFEKEVLNPMMADIDNTVRNHFHFVRKSWLTDDLILKFKHTEDENELFTDNWFKTNKSISKELKDDYFYYRKKYAGVELSYNY